MYSVWMAVLFLACVMAVPQDFSTEDHVITANWQETADLTFFQVDVEARSTGDKATHRLLVEKVSSGTFWSLPNLYYQTQTSNATDVFVAPTISYDSLMLLNETAPFASLTTLPLDQTLVSAFRFTSYLDNCLIVTSRVDRLEISINSNPGLANQLTVRGYYFFRNTTFQGRNMTPLDFKMDVSMSSNTPAPQRVGLATSWWGGGGTLPTGTGNELDVFWKIVSTTSQVGALNWECARNVTVSPGGIGANVLVRAFASQSPAFQFWGMFDAVNVQSVNWDPTVTVLTGVAGDDQPNIGVIVGAVVGAIGGGILIALLIVVITRRRIAQRNKASTQLLRERTRTENELPKPN